MPNYRLSQAAARLGLSRARVDQLVRDGSIAAQVDPLSGWRYIEEAELERFQALTRPAGRPWNKIRDSENKS